MKSKTITRSSTLIKTATLIAVGVIIAAAAAGLFIQQQNKASENKSAGDAPVLDESWITEAQPKFVSGQLIVQLNHDVDAKILKNPGDKAEGLKKVYTDFDTPKVKSVFELSTDQKWEDKLEKTKIDFPQRTARANNAPVPVLDRFYTLEFNVDDDRLVNILNELQGLDQFKSVSYNNIYHATVIPNDPYFSSTGSWGQSYDDLWGLKQVNAPRAWRSSATIGSSSIVVGVIDTGLDAAHSDIIDNLYNNTGEITGNGIDDDANGYIDDVLGWDFVNDDNDSTDDHFHGTHVAGTIAAIGNNSIGVTGMMWDAQILPIKVLDNTGSGSSTDIANAIIYAANQGVDVINLSLGFSGSDSTVEAAIETAYGLGTVVVAAAGNDSDDALNYTPASLDEVITVASSDINDELSSFSNYGSKIDVVAPGENVLSLLASGAATDEIDSSRIVDTDYYQVSGTSMATPHVVGAVGLMLSNDGTLSVEETRQAIRDANDTGDPGPDDNVGYGRLNINKAINRPSQCEAYITDPVYDGEISNTLSISGYAGGQDFSRYVVKVYSGTGSGATEVSSSSSVRSAVSNDGLASLKFPELVPGEEYSIRLFVFDAANQICGLDIRDVSGSYTLSSYNLSSSARDVEIVDDRAYVADFLNGLYIFDISDTSNPVLLDNTIKTGSYGVHVSDDYVYLAGKSSGLEIISIASSSGAVTASLLGSYNTSGTAHSVVVSGDYAYVADSGSGLQIIDVSDPASPTLIGSYVTGGNAYDVAISGDYAYVVDYTHGLQVIDVSDPTAPALVGDYLDGYYKSITINGDYVYIADYYAGLVIINISDPNNPALTGQSTADFTYYANDITLSGDYVYLAKANNDIVVYNVSLPTSPFLVHTYPTQDVSYAVDVEDGIGVTGTAEGIELISLTAPESEVIAVYTGNYDTSGYAYDVAMVDNYAYIADNDGLFVVDASYPAAPVLVYSDTSIAAAQKIIIDDDYAYISEVGNGFEIFDISDPVNPVLAAHYTASGRYTMEIDIMDSYAYVANYDAFDIVDISDPTNPTLIGSYDVDPGTAYHVSVSGNYAIIGEDATGFEIFDISDPTNPSLISSYSTSGSVAAVSISGSYAYVTYGYDGFEIFDISDPTNPITAESYLADVHMSRLAIEGDYLYVTDGDAGLKIYDISDPSSSSLVTSYDTLNWALGLDIVGDYIYQCVWSSGLEIIYTRLP